MTTGRVTTSLEIQQSPDGEIYIAVGIDGNDQSGMADAIPSEIAGYEVRVTITKP